MTDPTQRVASAGLCATCRHSRVVTSARGTDFWRCNLHDTEPRLAKYPRLPVIACIGYAEGEATD